MVGYIGPDGAGKSTTVKTLAGILVPDSGQCEIVARLRGVALEERRDARVGLTTLLAGFAMQAASGGETAARGAFTSGRRL